MESTRQEALGPALDDDPVAAARRLVGDPLQGSVARLVASLDPSEPGVILAVNAAASELFGLGPRDVPGRNVLDVNPPAERAGALRRLSRLVSGEVDSVQTELQCLRSDGSTFWAQTRSVSVPDPGDFSRPSLLLVEAIDVSERHNHEQALVDSEARFRDLFESAPIGIAVVGLDGSWLRLNDAVCRITGYSREELQTRDFQSITHPGDLEADLRNVEALLSGEIDNYQMHKRYLRKDGRPIWCLLSVTLLRDELSRPLHFLSQIVDVDAERTSSALIDTLFAASADLMLVASPELRVLRANLAWQRQLGWSESDLQATDLLSLVHPDDLAATRSDIETAAADSPWSLRTRLRIRARDSSYRWIDVSAGQLPESPLVVATGRDVTEEKTRQLALEAAEAQAQMAFEAMPVGIALADERGTVVRVNEAWGELSGRDSQAIAGTAWSEMFLAEDEPALAAALASVWQSAATQLVEAPSRRSPAARVEARFVRPDGSVVWASLGLTTVVGANCRRYVLAEAEDITARRREARNAEAELERLRVTVAVQREILACEDPTTVMQLVADRVGNMITTAHGAAVELVEGYGLRYVATWGDLAGTVGTTVDMGSSLSGRVISSRTTMRCDDASNDARVDRGVCASLGIVSMVLAPVFAEGVPVGVIKVTSPLRGVFTETDEQQLTLLANALSGALRQAAEASRSAVLLVKARDALSALAASENRFYSAFAGSALGMLLTTAGSSGGVGAEELVLVNDAASAITGWACDDLVGMRLADLVLPDDRPPLTEAIEKVLSRRTDRFSVQLRVIHRDGRFVWAQIHGALVTDAHRTPLHLVLQVQDVTADRQLRKDLAERAQLLDLAQDAVVVRGLDGRINFWNPGAERLYGWPAAVAIGHDMDRLLDTRRVGGLADDDVLQELLTKGSAEGEMTHRCADGRRVVVHSRKALQRDAEGRAIAVLSINTDITARRKAELDLATSEQLFRSQFSSSAVGMVIRGAHGFVEQVNPAMAAMMGCTENDLVGQHITNLMEPEGTEVWQAQMAQIFSGELESFEGEGRLVCPDQRRVLVHASLAVIRNADGQPERFIGIYQDISARAAAEAARDAALADLAVRNQALEATNQLKVDLMGMLGHEIGNPLAAILGYTEMAKAGWSQLSDGDREGVIVTIDRNARRVDAIVREVLALVAIESDRLTATPEIVTLRDHLDAAVSGTSATITCHATLQALVDPGHLDHILSNLVSNAVKYAGGPIAVDAQPAGHRVLIRVEDAGPGISEGFRPRLFDRFTRDAATSSSSKGTGLGLHIVKQLTEANGGLVDHDARLGGGSVFTVVLPATPASSTPALSAHLSSAHLSSAHLSSGHVSSAHVGSMAASADVETAPSAQRPDSTGTPASQVRHFSAKLTEVRRVRAFVRGVLEAHDMTVLSEDALLLVSEVCSNAVIHAATPFTVHVRVSTGSPRLAGGRLWVGVEDGSCLLARRHQPVPDTIADSAGRGLDLVDALATSWGNDPRGNGKVVWFTL